jgi:hypothetical protein
MRFFPPRHILKYPREFGQGEPGPAAISARFQLPLHINFGLTDQQTTEDNAAICPMDAFNVCGQWGG